MALIVTLIFLVAVGVAVAYFAPKYRLWLQSQREEREFQEFCNRANKVQGDIDALINEAVMNMTEAQRQNIIDNWEL